MSRPPLIPVGPRPHKAVTVVLRIDHEDGDRHPGLPQPSGLGSNGEASRREAQYLPPQYHVTDCPPLGHFGHARGTCD